MYRGLGPWPDRVMSTLNGLILPDDLHFRFEFDATLPTRGFLDLSNESEDILGGRIPVIDDEIPVDFAHFGRADPGVFQSHFIHELPSSYRLRIFKNTPRTRCIFEAIVSSEAGVPLKTAETATL